jgi:asparagine synthase (glutamine-hydrolysing)
MCGITGAFGPGVGSLRSLVEAFSRALQHRGPDGEGIWVASDNRAVLGHRRLAIIDLSETGRQPMLSRSGRFAAVFNGEIYNFRELREQLASLGHIFYGASDTEVMLAAFDQWGVSASVPYLNGMFAVAVYDLCEKTLWLFRDRLGLKPLYYQWKDDNFYFSSELTQPFAAISTREIDLDALALYLRHNCVPAPHTIYRGIYKLAPGIIAQLAEDSPRGQLVASRYWDSAARAQELLARRDESMSLAEATDRVSVVLRRSVAQRMISDVPVGAFLSGGVDSSLIVAQMQQLSHRPVRTFTIGFDEAERNESDHARRVAAYLGTDHTELRVTERDALEVIPRLPAIYGEPFADSSQIPTFLVSQLTRQFVTVALSGDGGDELFAGYRSYQMLERVRSRADAVPGWAYALATQAFHMEPIACLASKLMGDQRYEWAFNALRLFSGGAESRIPLKALARYSLSERLLAAPRPGASVQSILRCGGMFTETKMCDDICRYLPDDILTKVDRASMAASLEVRAPFVDDHELFSVAWSLPARHKSSAQTGKLVLRELLSRSVPQKLFERPKMGFSIPLPQWLNGPLRAWVDDCVSPERLRREGLLAPAVVTELVRAVRRRPDEWLAYKLWAICIFQSWLQNFHFATASETERISLRLEKR